MRCAWVMVIVAGCSSASTHTGPPPSQNMFSKAEAYERYMGRWSRPLAPAMLEFVQLHDGDAVLDVGSGTGVLSFAVRDATKTSRITGIDLSADYVAYAARHADPRVHFQVGDAQRLELNNASFDATLSLLVINFVPDPAGALEEMKRVTKPGGTVAAAVWDYGKGMEMLRVFWDEAVAFDPAIEPRDEAHMPLSRSGELGALWKQHGMENVQESPLTIALHFASFDDYWAPFLLGQGPAGAYVVSLSKDRQAQLAERLRRRLLANGPDRAIDMQARVWAVKGTVPR